MATPSKPKTTIDIEEDRPTHSDDEDETPQHQTEDDSNAMTPEHDSIWTPKRPKRDYKNDVKELEERLKTKEKEMVSERNKSVTDLMNPVALDHAQRCENIRTLMDSIFSFEEMATCAVTGKKGVIGEKRPRKSGASNW
ncbi:unnamed protein product [Leuciscus chuanchicus]